MRRLRRPRMVVLGMMSKIPVAGVVWQTLHYLLGFDRLGFETYYVEAHARTPSMLMSSEQDDSAALAASFIAHVLERHGFKGQWAFQALHDDARCFGLSSGQLARLYRDAALVVNLHGGTAPLPEQAATERLVYLETDPVAPQIELFDEVQETIDFLDRHAAHFTFAENYAGPGCALPVSGRYEFYPTRQPVVLDLWEGTDPREGGRFTTIANWSQPWRNVRYDGHVYGWSKDEQFRRLIDLPAATTAPLELALSNCDDEDRQLLEEHGWGVRAALEVSADTDAYRRYIQDSLGEFSVAKEQNVALRTGWFSDRSATYLAAGRPVIMQDTGFGEALPTGAGLLSFCNFEEAAAALDAVRADYRRHTAAATALARSHFSHEVVLGALLDILDVRPGRRRRTEVRAHQPRRPDEPAEAALPEGLVLQPVSKRPMRLDPRTVELLAERRRTRTFAPSRPGAADAAEIQVSVVVPVHDHVELTQLCLESVLAETPERGYELIVIDDGSTDDTACYLSSLATAHAQLQVLTNTACAGFSRAINRGITQSRGEQLILLNNDTIVTPGWMAALLAHLDDPEVGLVTACTTGHSRNCRVVAEFHTYGELKRIGTERCHRVNHGDRGDERALSMAPLFCAALRREVLEQIGPLDERFDVGMFEDDDYSLRLRRAGYRLACALDAFVHHYGEGTLGDFFADGAHHALFEANRAKFERKWKRRWDGTSVDQGDPAYLAAVNDARSLLAREVPSGEVVAVVSRGDVALVKIEGRHGWHFPRTADGDYLGAHPADGTEAVAFLERARRDGARWFFVPEASGWWLDHYPQLADRLVTTGRLVCREPSGRLYRLDDVGLEVNGVTSPASSVASTDPGVQVTSACTIIARNYLAQARVLAQSYFTHHPDGRFYLLVVDGLPAAAELDARIQLVDPHDLPVDNLYEMFFKYDVVELSTAVKPALLILLTERWDEERMMYIDPDVLITRPMTEVFEALERADVVLTPHLNEPIPCDDRSPSEQDILISGAYNLGFIALRRSRETARFLDWWRERLNDLCRVEPSGGLMVDQRWIDLAPSLFPSAFILHDSTYNVAYWNLHARQIERTADGYTCNGRPLVMFHFSGYDPERPDVLSKHQTRTELVAGTALHELFTAYGQAVLAAGFQESKRWGYDLATFDNGIGLHAIFRRLYLELDAETRRAFGDPFETEPEGSFFQWATATQPGCRQLSPFLETAYRLRYDVQGVFPDVAGEHRLGFLRWAGTQGAAEFGYEPELVLRCEPSLELPTGTPPSAAPARREQQTPADPAGGEPSQASAAGNLAGVNVCGYLRNESGLGSAARGYIQVLNSLGVPVSLRDVSELSANRSDDSSISVFHGDHPYPVNLVCVNADQHFVVMRQDPSFFEHKYNIGVWFWELPSFPSEWHDRFDHYDEIWAGSSYIANTLAPLSPIPVVRIQPLLGPQLAGNRQRGRDRLGIGNEFLFLFMFDFHSYFQRKNPLAVVEAFRQAFAPTDGARLVIKSVNGSSSVSEADMLRTAIGADSRITLIDGYISSAEVADLTSACDCYVSLHRAEGMGLTMAHAMATGKPAIATGWSGNTDFMDASNSLLVRFDLVELEHDVGPYKAGGTWADPDIDHASALMRHLFDRPDEAAALGLAAQRDLAARFSVERIGQVAAARLQVVADRLEQPRLRAAPVTIQHGGNAVLMGAIRRIVAEAVGRDTRPVAVVSKGDPVLVDLSDHPGWHFPQDDDGVYAGYYPGDSDTAVAHLEHLRQRGAGYFLVPATCRWWLSHYSGLRHHLDTHYQLVAEDMSCVLYRLDSLPEGSPRPIDEQPASAESQPTFEDLQGQIEHLRATLAATGDWVSDLAPRVAGGERRLSAIPPVLRDAFASVAHTVGEIESDLEDRMAGIERAHGHLAALMTETTAQLQGLASQVESSRGSHARQLVAAQDVDRRLEELESRSSEHIDGVADRLTTLSAEVAKLARHRRALERRPDIRPVTAGKEHGRQRLVTPEADGDVRNNELIADASELVDGALGRVSVVERRLASRPYMSTDRFFTDDPDRALGFSRDDSREAERADRPTFADAFRGERSFVADRQRSYLAFFNECTLVVDLGCGRGEFLELLAHQGVLAMGVDLDGSLVRACQRRGLRVQQQDALAFLQHAAPASVDGIFSAQFIEHVDPSRLLDLLVWARRALQAGGTFVAETVNPENYEALKAFYVDLTHQRPIFPQVLLHLCWEAGFEAAWIFYPEGGGFTQRCYDSVGEYAVIARA